MDAVMRSCAGRPNSDWSEAASHHCDRYGYQDTLAWLCKRIGSCGRKGFGPETDVDFLTGESLTGEVTIFSHRLKERIVLTRGAFLRIVFPNPAEAQQLRLF